MKRHVLGSKDIVTADSGYPPEVVCDFFPIIKANIMAYMDAPVIIKAELGDWKMPSIIVVINGNEYRALIDTAAYYGMYDAAKIIVPEIITDKVLVDRPDIGIKEKPAYELLFKIKGFTFDFKEPFTPMPKPNYQFAVILGTHFLSRCKLFNYYGNENRFELIV